MSLSAPAAINTSILARSTSTSLTNSPCDVEDGHFLRRAERMMSNDRQPTMRHSCEGNFRPRDLLQVGATTVIGPGGGMTSIRLAVVVRHLFLGESSFLASSFLTSSFLTLSLFSPLHLVAASCRCIFLGAASVQRFVPVLWRLARSGRNLMESYGTGRRRRPRGSHTRVTPPTITPPRSDRTTERCALVDVSGRLPLGGGESFGPTAQVAKAPARNAVPMPHQERCHRQEAPPNGKGENRTTSRRMRSGKTTPRKTLHQEKWRTKQPARMLVIPRRPDHRRRPDLKKIACPEVAFAAYDAVVGVRSYVIFFLPTRRR